MRYHHIWHQDTRTPELRVKIQFYSKHYHKFSGDKLNLARIKFFGLFICALCKVQKGCFEKLTASFETDAKVDSFLRRIQRFMSEYLPDTSLIAHFVFALLPHKPPYRLALM